MFEHALWRQNRLRWAIINDSDELFEISIDDGWTDLNEENEQGITPLRLAVLYNRADMIERLVERGALINKRCTDGKTAHDDAEKNGYRSIINFLKEKALLQFIMPVTENRV